MIVEAGVDGAAGSAAAPEAGPPGAPTPWEAANTGGACTGTASMLRPGAARPVGSPSSTRDHSAPRPKYIAIAITPRTASRSQVRRLPEPPLSKPSAPWRGSGASSLAAGRSSAARTVPPTEASSGSTSACSTLPQARIAPRTKACPGSASQSPRSSASICLGIMPSFEATSATVQPRASRAAASSPGAPITAAARAGAEPPSPAAASGCANGEASTPAQAPASGVGSDGLAFDTASIVELAVSEQPRFRRRRETPAQLRCQARLAGAIAARTRDLQRQPKRLCGGLVGAQQAL